METLQTVARLLQIGDTIDGFKITLIRKSAHTIYFEAQRDRVTRHFHRDPNETMVIERDNN